MIAPVQPHPDERGAEDQAESEQDNERSSPFAVRPRVITEARQSRNAVRLPARSAPEPSTRRRAPSTRIDEIRCSSVRFWRSGSEGDPMNTRLGALIAVLLI